MPTQVWPGSALRTRICSLPATGATGSGRPAHGADADRRFGVVGLLVVAQLALVDCRQFVQGALRRGLRRFGATRLREGDRRPDARAAQAQPVLGDLGRAAPSSRARGCRAAPARQRSSACRSCSGMAGSMQSWRVSASAARARWAASRGLASRPWRAHAGRPRRRSRAAAALALEAREPDAVLRGDVQVRRHGRRTPARHRARRASRSAITPSASNGSAVIWPAGAAFR